MHKGINLACITILYKVLAFVRRPEAESWLTVTSAPSSGDLLDITVQCQVQPGGICPCCIDHFSALVYHLKIKMSKKS